MRDEPVFRFHVSRAARERYGFARELYGSTGSVVFLDLHAARIFTRRINEARGAVGPGPAEVPAPAAGLGPEAEPLRSGDMNAMGLIDEILHYMAGLYRRRVDPLVFSKALAFLEGRLDPGTVEAALRRFVEDFPPSAVFEGSVAAAEYLAGATGALSHREIVLEEMLHLALANGNPAFSPFRELFDDDAIGVATRYGDVVEGLKEFFKSQPPFGPDNEDLVSMLGAPVRAAPRSLSGQLEYIRSRWGALLGDLLLRLLTGLDVIREEEKLRIGSFAPGLQTAPEYAGQAAEREAFSSDTDWMPRVVMIAKNALVWLDQLSRRHGREIRRLDQVPDEELDRLAGRGFTALWLIGVWERSPASREIKRRMGNPEAEASAYSLREYAIAGELGGEPALQDLKRRAWQRGIRMASDMVPNHAGIDSRWMIERPDRFLAWPHPWPPYPSYSFNGPNLSGNESVGVFLEDHYWDRRDAAVVFKRVDFATGDTRYIYHGNDGTHMPWNDTAQLDFLKSETREAVLGTILDVARMFPIIRFDAAMTLARKHFQRLWFPEPGHGGDIPSRAGNGLTRHDFERAMPNEFWREVVDRVARDAPDTLLLAEAFWMLEGFFVRTLGMHRVYNSAFMNMLKTEDNAGYRQAIRNTLEFDPEVLKRFVNFMSNPDEETAIAQFGDGDKYFGVCTLMVTMPGLPMFAHGQVDGFREKYGMEYRRAYREESPDSNLVERHEREIFPLMKRRRLFAGVENFLLFDFFTPEDGGVNENVFAYSNRLGDERCLVLYNNKYSEVRGWVRQSAAFAVKSGSGKTLARKSLAEGLALPADPAAFAVFRDQVSGLQYIRGCREISEKGMYAELGAFRRQVFLDFSIVHDDAANRWSRLAGELAGRGVASVDAALREMELRPVREPFRALANPGFLAWMRENGESFLVQAVERYGRFLSAVARFAPGAVDARAAGADFQTLLRGIIAPVKGAPTKAAPAVQKPLPFLWLWSLVRPLCGSGGTDASGDSGCAAISWIEEWMLAPLMAGFLAETGWDPRSAEAAPALLACLLRVPEGIPKTGTWRELFADPAVHRFLRVNSFEGVLWFGKEELGLLLACVDAIWRARKEGAVRSKAILAIAEKSGFQWEAFLAGLPRPRTQRPRTPRAKQPARGRSSKPRRKT